MMKQRAFTLSALCLLLASGATYAVTAQRIGLSFSDGTPVGEKPFMLAENDGGARPLGPPQGPEERRYQQAPSSGDARPAPKAYQDIAANEPAENNAAGSGIVDSGGNLKFGAPTDDKKKPPQPKPQPREQNPAADSTRLR